MGKKLASIISLAVGISIFLVILWSFGFDSISEIIAQANPIYLLPFIGFVLMSVSLQALQLKVVVKGHGYDIPFFKSLKYVLSGLAVSNSTPTAKLGGEPVKAYMMKKESGVPFSSGGSSVVIDRLIGVVGVGVITLLVFLMIFLVPEISFQLKLLMAVAILLCFALIFLVYYSTMNGKGTFSSLFNIFGFYKLKKMKKPGDFLKNVDKRMEKFSKNNKARFFLALLIYIGFVSSQLLEYKFILLALGIDASFFELALALVVFWIANVLPVPGGIGFQEAGHSGLFSLLRDSAGLGFVFSLIIRARYLIIIGIGFTILTHFSSTEIMKKIREKKSVSPAKNN